MASGFGVGIAWQIIFGDKKGGGTLAPFLFSVLIYFLNLNIAELSVVFLFLLLIYFLCVEDNAANDDPSWITLDEIVGMSLVSLASPSKLLPLIAGFLVFRASDILKQPKFVAELENYPGKLGVLYDDLGAGLLGFLSATIVNQVSLLSF
ncbi:MAG: phosphatidylglycerophosphatase A [Candidatus Actinomarinaceae bacterium]|tara:strand:- start:170 stop:619 length:450 start_codon:yes stop_codon:yes gene_type:complete